jgi:hypothetical protein
MSLNESHIVGIVTVLYAWVGLSYGVKGDWPWALTWTAYALANVGLILAARE